MNFISTLITISYLFRSFRHISLRTNIYIAILLLLFFLTSSYQITYLDFLISLNNINYSFEGFINIIRNWFTGSPLALMLSVLLYIISKNSNFKLSSNLINELILLAIGVIIVFIRNLNFLSFSPIILSLAICHLIHIYKNEKYINFISSGIYSNLENISSLNLLDKVRLIIAFLFVIFATFSETSIGNLELLSNAHIGRIIFSFSILFIAIYSNHLLFKKMLITLLPVSIIYLGLICSSILNNSVGSNLPNSSLSLESMTSIAFFPLVEVVINKYCLISPKQELSFIKIPAFIFKLMIKFIIFIIVLTYLFYLFTQ